MSDEKHSPGPWRWTHTGDDDCGDTWLVSADGEPVALLEACGGRRWNADAALVARAPDLLAEVERLRAELAEALCWRETARDWESMCNTQAARAERLEAALRWALGEGDSTFRARRYGDDGRPLEGQFYWRKELSDRAALSPAPPVPVEAGEGEGE